MKYTLEQFKANVIQWSTDRDIIKYGTVEGQLKKIREEVNETIDGLITLNKDEIKDGIGDCAVVLINLDALQSSKTKFHTDIPVTSRGAFELISSVRYYAEITIEDYSESWDCLLALSKVCGLDFMDCCELAWNEIKDRKGYFCDKTKTFVKES